MGGFKIRDVLAMFHDMEAKDQMATVCVLLAIAVKSGEIGVYKGQLIWETDSERKDLVAEEYNGFLNILQKRMDDKIVQDGQKSPDNVPPLGS